MVCGLQWWDGLSGAWETSATFSLPEGQPLTLALPEPHPRALAALQAACTWRLAILAEEDGWAFFNVLSSCVLHIFAHIRKNLRLMQAMCKNKNHKVHYKLHNCE